MNLGSVTLLGIDGAGNRPNIIKAMQHSMRSLNFEKCILLSPEFAWPIYSYDERILLKNIKKLNYREWNKFVIKELYQYINTDYYLFVDTDGFVLNPSRWDNNFLNYDYIGASWRLTGESERYCNFQNLIHKNSVGNGGFTLRSKKLLIEASKLDYEGSPEDAFLCLKSYDHLINRGIKFAPDHIADIFSTDPYDGKSFGFHGNKELINLI